MKELNKLRQSALISLLIILFSCQSPPLTKQNDSLIISKNTDLKVNPVNNPIIIPALDRSSQPISSPKITVTQTTNDEEVIKQLIISNPDYFPTNINSDDEALEATVPNNGGVVFATVPNNGGVVFLADKESSLDSFGTKAILDRIIDRSVIKNRVKEQIKAKITESIAIVVRKTIGEPKKDFKIIFNSQKTQADVTITTTFIREVLLNRKVNPLVKKFKEESIVSSVFIKEDGNWKLNQISPIDSKTIETENKIKIESVKITITSNNSTSKEQIKTTELDINNLKNKMKLLSLSKGDIITIETKINSGDTSIDLPLQVFARLSATKTRIPLYDDGGLDLLAEGEEKQISGDSIKNDDIYTANIALNNKKGVNYLIIDILNPLTDNNKSVDNFNYISKSIPIIIR